MWPATSQTSIAWGTTSVTGTRKCSSKECVGTVRRSVHESFRGENCFCALIARIRSNYRGCSLTRSFAPGLFVHDLLPAISYHLFSDTLQRVELSHSQQVDDATLDLLATCGCHPVSIVIENCPSVTGQRRCCSRHLTIRPHGNSHGA